MKNNAPLRLLALSISATVFCTASVHAQSTAVDHPSRTAWPTSAPAINLDEVIRRVLSDSPSLIAGRRSIEAAQALRQQAALRPNPVLSVDQQRVPSGNRAYSVGLNFPIELGGRRAARIAAAESGTMLARADVEQLVAEVRAIAIRAYFDVLVAQDRVDLARASRELAGRATDVAGRRVQAGRVSPVEEARARVAEASAGIELSQAITELDTARVRLAALWGESSPAPSFLATLPGTRQVEIWSDETLRQRIDEAPSVLRARAEVSRLASLASVERSLASPEAAFNVGTGTLIETGDRSNVIGLSVSIPFFNRNQGNILAADVRYEQSKDSLRAIELAVRAEAAQAITRLRAGWREVEVARERILPEAMRTLDSATRGFELGKFGFLDVLDAQRAVFATRGQLIRALSDAYQSEAELERLLGPGTATPDTAQSR